MNKVLLPIFIFVALWSINIIPSQDSSNKSEFVDENTSCINDLVGKCITVASDFYVKSSLINSSQKSFNNIIFTGGLSLGLGFLASLGLFDMSEEGRKFLTIGAAVAVTGAAVAFGNFRYNSKQNQLLSQHMECLKENVNQFKKFKQSQFE